MSYVHKKTIDTHEKAQCSNTESIPIAKTNAPSFNNKLVDVTPSIAKEIKCQTHAVIHNISTRVCELDTKKNEDDDENWNGSKPLITLITLQYYLLLNILDLLDTKSLKNFNATCRYFNDIIQSQYLIAISHSSPFCHEKRVTFSYASFSDTISYWMTKSSKDIRYLQENEENKKFPELLFYDMSNITCQTKTLRLLHIANIDTKEHIRLVKFSPDSKQLFILFDFSKTAQIWSSINGTWSTEPSYVFHQESSIQHASFNNDWTRLVTISYCDYIARVWKLNNGQWSKEAILDKHTGILTYCSFSKENPQRIVTISKDQSASFWGLLNDKWELLKTTFHNENERENKDNWASVPYVSYAKFRSDNTKSVIKFEGHPLGIYDTDNDIWTEETIFTDICCNIQHAKLSPNRQILVLTLVSHIEIWEWRTISLECKCDFHKSNATMGTWKTVVNKDKSSYQLWEPKIRNYKCNQQAPKSSWVRETRINQSNVSCIKFSPNGIRFVTIPGWSYGSPKVWKRSDDRTWNMEASLDMPANNKLNIRYAIFNPFGTHIVVFTCRAVKIWALFNGAWVVKYTLLSKQNITNIKFNPCGTHLLISNGKCAGIYEIESSA